MNNIEAPRPTIEILTGHAENIRERLEALIETIRISTATEDVPTNALKTAIDNAQQDGLALNNQLAPLTQILSQYASIASASGVNDFPTLISLNGTAEQRKIIIDALQPMVTLLGQPQEMLDKLEVERKAGNALDMLQMDFMTQAISKTIRTGAQIMNSPDQIGTILAQTLPATGMDAAALNQLGSIFTQSQQVQKQLGTLPGTNGLPATPAQAPAQGPTATMSQGNLNTGNQFRQTTLGIATQLFNRYPGLARIFGIREGASANEAAEHFVDGFMGALGDFLATHVSQDKFLKLALPGFRKLGISLTFRKIILAEAERRGTDQRLSSEDRDRASLTAEDRKKTETIIARLNMTPEMQSNLLECITKRAEFKRQGKNVIDLPDYAACLTREATDAYLARLNAAVASTPNASPNQAPNVISTSIGNYFQDGLEKQITHSETQAIELHARDQMKLKFFKTADTPAIYKMKINDTRVITLETAPGTNMNDLRIANETQANRDPANIRVKLNGNAGAGMRLTYIMDKIRDNTSATKVHFPAGASDSSQIVANT